MFSITGQNTQVSVITGTIYVQLSPMKQRDLCHKKPTLGSRTANEQDRTHEHNVVEAWAQLLEGSGAPNLPKIWTDP